VPSGFSVIGGSNGSASNAEVVKVMADGGPELEKGLGERKNIERREVLSLD